MTLVAQPVRFHLIEDAPLDLAAPPLLDEFGLAEASSQTAVIIGGGSHHLVHVAAHLAPPIAQLDGCLLQGLEGRDIARFQPLLVTLEVVPRQECGFHGGAGGVPCVKLLLQSS